MSYYKNYTIKFLFFAIGCLLFNIGISQDSNSIKSEFNSKLTKYSSDNKTIISNFELIKNIKQLKEPVKSYGTFFYDNNGAMALIYSNPPGDKIRLKDNTCYIVVGGKLNTANGTNNPMLEQITQVMNACMRGEVSELGRGWESTYSVNNDDYVIELIPIDKRTNKYLSSIILNFDKTNLSLNNMIIN